MGSCDPHMKVQYKKTDMNARQNLRSRRSSDVLTRNIAMSVMCLCAVVCVGDFVYTRLRVKELSDKLTSTEAELSQLRQQIRQILSSHESPEELNGSAEITSEIIYRQKRSHKNSKKPRPTSNLPPFIHLFGKINGRRHMEKDYTYFTWDKADLNPGIHGFDLEGDPDGGYHKIKVKHQGVYLIYAQVAVHGRDNVNKPYECSHETVCTRQSGERIVLLSSLVTQYHLGRPYEQNDQNQGLRALDTKVHMGVFMLQSGDVLSVQIPPSCENMEYSMTPQQSYFGLAKLNNHKEKVVKPAPQTTTNKHKNGKKGHRR